jgi:hypothetical protein
LWRSSRSPPRAVFAFLLRRSCARPRPAGQWCLRGRNQAWSQHGPPGGFRSALIEKKDRTTESSPWASCYCPCNEAIDRPDPRLTSAAATELLLWLIARDDVGMTADMVSAQRGGPDLRGGRGRPPAQGQEVKPRLADTELPAFVSARWAGRPRPERSRCLIDWSTNRRWVLRVVEVCPTSALAGHSRPCARRIGTLPVEHAECR